MIITLVKANFSANNIFKKIGMLILDVKGNFYKQINIPQNKKLRKRINKINEIFNKKYQQIDELVGLTQERNEKYRCSSYSSCEDCEEFFNTHTLVDVIGYSFVKNPVAEYPIGVGNKMK